MRHVVSVFIGLFLLVLSVSPSLAQSYVPVVFLRAEAQQVVAGQPVTLTVVGNTLGTVLRRVEAYIILEGDTVPQRGYTYALAPGKAESAFDVSIYEESSSTNKKIIHMMIVSNHQDGANWGSEAVPLMHIRFIPTQAGSISTYLGSDTSVSYGNQTSLEFDNYTPVTRPYVLSVVSNSPISPTLSPRPTQASPTPNYEQEYEALKEEVTTLKSDVQEQGRRLSFLENIIAQIQAFFAILFKQ